MQQPSFQRQYNSSSNWRQDRLCLSTEFQKLAAKRVRELNRVYYDQFPYGLPHNSLGVKYCKYILRTMAFFLSNSQRADWLNENAPWLETPIRNYLLDLAPHWYSGASLGQHLELENEARERLRAWSIKATDVTDEERVKTNREKNRIASERRRRKKGAKPRAQYEAESTSQTKPWEAQGISRRTWYRKDGTGASRPYLNNSQDDAPVPFDESQGRMTASMKQMKDTCIPSASIRYMHQPASPQAASLFEDSFHERRNSCLSEAKASERELLDAS